MERRRIYITIYIFCLLAALALCLPAHGGWSENIRLSYGGHEINPQVIARNDTVHVVWSQMSDNIMYKRSVDGGLTWDDSIILNEDDHNCGHPDLSLDENGLFVSWQDRDDFYVIAYSTSEDGSSWAEPQYIFTDNFNYAHKPASTVKGDSIFITYFSYRDDSTGMWPLQFMSSYNYGQTWNDEVTIDHPFSTQQRFLIKYCHGILLSVRSGYADSFHSYYHIIGYRSRDAGQTWSDTLWISPENELLSQAPCVVCNDESGQYAVGYQDHRYEQYPYHGDTFIKTTSDSGQTWPFETQASFDHTAIGPDIDYIADTLVVVWSDRKFYDQGLHEIFFNRSNDGGENWEGETRLTNTSVHSGSPWVSFDNSKIYVVWMEDVAGYEIFFKYYEPDTNTYIDNNSVSPSEFRITVYPNPFNSSLSININSLSSGALQIYDILGRVVREYNFVKGKTLINWDACDASGEKVSAGVYFTRARTPRDFTTIKLIYLK